MINLNVNETNTFAIYSDTITSDVQTFGDYFLIGFKSLYSNHWAYVIPTIVKRNRRYVQFNLTVVQQNEPDDPYNAILSMFPPGGWEYKLWNLDNPVLDPSIGILVDQGQAMVGEYDPAEVVQITYVSDNDTFKSAIYYSGNLNNCIINYANSPYIIATNTINTCQPLFVETTGYLLIEAGKTLTLTS